MPDFSKLNPGWFCFNCLPKKEHIASELLKRQSGMETFCPRISYLKKTRRGKVRFVESLFPGYLFVHADLAHSYRLIRSTQGIRDIVFFGDRVPEVPEPFILELRSLMNEENLKAIPEPALKNGQKVTITVGPFREWSAIVNGEMDARSRVGLLLDFLGRQMEVRLPVSELILESDEPKGRIWDS